MLTLTLTPSLSASAGECSVGLAQGLPSLTSPFLTLRKAF
jgi:hypothetical protein